MILGFVDVIPIGVRIDRDRWPKNSVRCSLVRAACTELRSFPQRADAVGRERPLGGLAGDPPTSAQLVAGDCQIMGRGPNIAGGVVEDEVYEVNKFAVDPQRSRPLRKMHTLNPPCSHLRAVDALIQTGQRDTCGFYFQISIRGMSYASWVLALNWRRFSANDFSEALCQSDFTIEVRRRRARSRTSTG